MKSLRARGGIFQECMVDIFVTVYYLELRMFAVHKEQGHEGILWIALL